MKKDKLKTLQTIFLCIIIILASIGLRGSPKENCDKGNGCPKGSGKYDGPDACVCKYSCRARGGTNAGTYDGFREVDICREEGKCSKSKATKKACDAKGPFSIMVDDTQVHCTFSSISASEGNHKDGTANGGDYYWKRGGKGIEEQKAGDEPTP